MCTIGDLITANDQQSGSFDPYISSFIEAATVIAYDCILNHSWTICILHGACITQKVSKNTINIKFVVAVMITVDNGRRPGNYSYADVMCHASFTHMRHTIHSHTKPHDQRRLCIHSRDSISNEMRLCNRKWDLQSQVRNFSLAFLDDCESTNVYMRVPYAIYMETLTIKLLIYFVENCMRYLHWTVDPFEIAFTGIFFRK